MNKHTIIGNLVRDPETGTTDGGVNWCRFTVAVNRRWKKEGQPEADFFQVTAWRGLGDSCAKYLAKGRKVAVIGESRASAWIGRDGSARGQVEITADDVEFLSPGGSGSREPTDAEAPAAADPAGGMTPVGTDEPPY